MIFGKSIQVEEFGQKKICIELFLVVLPVSLNTTLIDYKELKIEQQEIGAGNFSKVHRYFSQFFSLKSYHFEI